MAVLLCLLVLLLLSVRCWVYTVLPCCNVGPEKKNCMDGSHFFMVLASAFASGTLFSITVMLILPEGVRMVDGAMGYKHEEQNQSPLVYACFLASS